MLVSELLKRPNKNILLENPTAKYLIDSNTRIGLEIELEDFNSIDYGLEDLWCITSDGSLRPRDYGREFVFNEASSIGNDFRDPFYGRNLEIAIKEFINLVSNKNFCLSERTGLHVHIDVLPLDCKHVTNFILLYSTLEYVLFRYCGMNRAELTYSKPFTEIDQFFLLEDISKSYNLQVLKSFTKKSALNVKSVLQKGTLEFRAHPSTVDFDEIINWINILLSIKNYSKMEIDFNELFTNASIDGSEEFLNKIFGNKLSKLLLTDYTRQDLYKGMRAVQHVVNRITFSDLKLTRV